MDSNVKYTIITNAGGGAGDALINGGGLCGSAWLAHDHRQVLGKVIKRCRIVHLVGLGKGR
jgi:hypothetical protein